MTHGGEVTWLSSANQQPNSHACVLLAVATVLPVSPDLLLDSATFVMRLSAQFTVTYCEARCARIHPAISKRRHIANDAEKCTTTANIACSFFFFFF